MIALVGSSRSEDEYRRPMRTMAGLDQRSIGMILSNISSYALINLLWYAKDRELTHRVLSGLSPRAADMLLDDLNEKWRGKNPNEAPESDLRLGREAALKVAELLHKVDCRGPVARRPRLRPLTNESQIHTCPNAHVAWLACLYFLLEEVGSRGVPGSKSMSSSQIIRTPSFGSFHRPCFLPMLSSPRRFCAGFSTVNWTGPSWSRTPINPSPEG